MTLNSVQADADTLSALFVNYRAFPEDDRRNETMIKVKDHKFVSYWPSKDPVKMGYSHLLVTEKVYLKLAKKQNADDKAKEKKDKEGIELEEKKKKLLGKLEKIEYWLCCKYGMKEEEDVNKII